MATPELSIPRFGHILTGEKQPGAINNRRPAQVVFGEQFPSDKLGECSSLESYAACTIVFVRFPVAGVVGWAGSAGGEFEAKAGRNNLLDREFGCH